MPVEYLTPAMEDRAMAVQASLAERGLHRAASIPDLLVAAAADVEILPLPPDEHPRRKGAAALVGAPAFTLGPAAGHPRRGRAGGSGGGRAPTNGTVITW